MSRAAHHTEQHRPAPRRKTVARLWTRWTRRHGHAPPTDDPGTRPASGGDPAPGIEDGALWRMRTTVRDEPGSLAALCTALAGL
ncbi:GNAT family N-acetyltransferase, partial [Streptomyces sp. TRM76130]|nr:GNAT family N-acetyltransferase [Streptomyces sp. TRM76130]